MEDRTACADAGEDVSSNGDGSANDAGTDVTEEETKMVLSVHPLHRVKRVYFVRHGQASHNVDYLKRGEKAYLDWQHVDARLTDHGIGQAKAAADTIRADGVRFDRIFVSSLTRCLQTCHHAVPAELRSGPVMVLEDIRETHGTHPVNKRRPASVLKREFPEYDFAHVVDEMDQLWSERRETPEELTKRVSSFLRFLMAQDASTMAVVSHSDTLTSLFGLPALNLPSPLHAKYFDNDEVVALAMLH